MWPHWRQLGRELLPGRSGARIGMIRDTYVVRPLDFIGFSCLDGERQPGDATAFGDEKGREVTPTESLNRTADARFAGDPAGC